MTVDWNSMLSSSTPLGPGLAPMGDNSMEIARLKLAQAQFENLKKNEQETREYARVEEAGRNARAQIVEQRAIATQQAENARAAAAQKAAVDAEALKNKQALYSKFTELNGNGKVDEARAMLPMMNQSGMSVELLGDQGGLPAYRVHMSQKEKAAADAKESSQGIGYPTNDSEPMTAPAGISSTEDAFNQAQAATPALSQAETGGQVTSEATDLPVDANEGTLEAGNTSMPAARSPDAPDLTGGVPSDVIDTGAQHAMTLQRLNPGLQGLVASYPLEYQDSARQTAQGVAGLGLPLTESLKAFQDARTGVDPRIQAQLAEGAQGGRAATAASAQAAQHAVENHQTGFSQAGKVAEEKGIKDYEDRSRNLEQARAMLTGSDRHSDQLAAYAIARMYDKGTLSDKDISAALGTSSESVLQRVRGWLTGKAVGGLTTDERKSLVRVLDQAKSGADTRVNEFLDATQGQIDNPDLDPSVRNGWRSYRDSITTKKTRDAYDAAHGRSQPSPGGGQRQFNMLQDAARNGPYDPSRETADIEIPPQSRIAAVHNNPGNLKYVGQEGATKGEPASDGGYWAKFETPDAGLAALRKQVGHDAKSGLTLYEYVHKYAPPSSNDTKTYLSQMLAALNAKSQDPLSSVDLDAVARFQAQKESGTIVRQSQAPARSSGERLAQLLDKGNY